MSSVSLAAWRSTWAGLGCVGDEALHARLCAAYGEPQRHYHTLHHLQDCLDKLAPARDHAERPGEVALGLWFHDAVYDPRRKDNEARSARWALEAAMGAGLAPETAQRIHALVMSTCHEALPEGADATLLVDIDLSILGATPQRFDESTAQIRREYAHVPEPAWRQGRATVLRRFLDRPRIYGTQGFHAQYEQQARDNLARSLAALLSG